MAHATDQDWVAVASSKAVSATVILPTSSLLPQLNQAFGPSGKMMIRCRAHDEINDVVCRPSYSFQVQKRELLTFLFMVKLLLRILHCLSIFQPPFQKLPLGNQSSSSQDYLLQPQPIHYIPSRWPSPPQSPTWSTSSTRPSRRYSTASTASSTPFSAPSPGCSAASCTSSATQSVVWDPSSAPSRASSLVR